MVNAATSPRLNQIRTAIKGTSEHQAQKPAIASLKIIEPEPPPELLGVSPKPSDQGQLSSPLQTPERAADQHRKQGQKDRA